MTPSTRGPWHLPTATDSLTRRAVLKRAGLGGLSLAAMLHAPIEEQVALASQPVNRNSKPSDLRITDLRIAEIRGAAVPRADHPDRHEPGNQRAGRGSRRRQSAVRARCSRAACCGENPCNVERLFKKVKQFGGHSRQGGGVSGVEMALWDLAGKAFEVPVYQMLGGRYRERIRLYADTTISRDKTRVREADEGPAGHGLHVPQDGPGNQSAGAGAGADHRAAWVQLVARPDHPHPFTAIQLTDKAIGRLVEYVAAVREAVGYEVPLAADHFGHFPVNDAIRLGRALDALPACLARGPGSLAVHRALEADHQARSTCQR